MSEPVFFPKDVEVTTPGQAPPEPKTPPEAEPETPEPEAPEEPETPEPPEPEDKPEESPETKARREARNLRQQIKSIKAAQAKTVSEAVEKATGERDDRIAELEGELRQMRVQVAAVGKFRDPSDAVRYVDEDTEDIPAALAAVLKDKPWLGATDGHAPPQGQQNGRQSAPNGGDTWLRSALQKK